MEKRRFIIEQNRNLQDVNEKLESNDYVHEMKEIDIKKKYHHWESESEEIRNRTEIANYNQKINEVRKVGLETEKNLLEKNPEVFDQKTRERMMEDANSNKIEVYSWRNFDEKAGVENGYIILGTHDMEGKIRLRDTDSIESLRETTIHETIHDMSFQSIEKDEEKQIKCYRSGIRVWTGWYEKTHDGKEVLIESNDLNRELNEGFTQLYTTETAFELSVNTNPNCYPEERFWAEKIREKLGNEVVEKAYFGGELEMLEKSFNERCKTPDAWNSLNEGMREYSYYRKLANATRFENREKWLEYSTMATQSREGVEKIVNELGTDSRRQDVKKR